MHFAYRGGYLHGHQLLGTGGVDRDSVVEIGLGGTHFHGHGETLQHLVGAVADDVQADDPFRITSYNVCYTKLLRMGCLDHPTAGEYRLEGREISGLSAKERARVRKQTIGFVFQSFNLLARTSALENVIRITSYNVCYTKLLRARAQRHRSPPVDTRSPAPLPAQR